MTNPAETLRAVLYRIASSSPRQSRIAERSYMASGSKTARNHKVKGLFAEWDTPEAHLVWSIYERAVYDHFGVGTGTHGFGMNPVIRNETAKTGLITLSSGKRMNILELLGIDPEWAYAQIKTALNYMQKVAA